MVWQGQHQSSSQSHTIPAYWQEAQTKLARASCTQHVIHEEAAGIMCTMHAVLLKLRWLCVAMNIPQRTNRLRLKVSRRVKAPSEDASKNNLLTNILEPTGTLRTAHPAAGTSDAGYRSITATRISEGQPLGPPFPSTSNMGSCFRKRSSNKRKKPYLSKCCGMCQRHCLPP